MAGIQNRIFFGEGEKLQLSGSVAISNMQELSTDVSRVNFIGNPNGNIAANPSSLCHDPVAGVLYLKISGSGNTGWSQLGLKDEVWSDISGAFSPLDSNGYFVTGTATGTLPVSPNQGDTIKFIVDHASQLLTIKANTGQFIRLGTAVTASAGTAVSTLQGDSMELVYRASDTTWFALSSVGSWNLT